MRRFEGQVAVVTGGSSGIGGATTRRLAEEGATVYSLDVVPPAFETGDLPVHYVPCDVSRWEAVQDAFGSVAGERLDVLVCSAGIHVFGGIEDVSVEDMARVTGVNLMGTLYALKCALPRMRAGGGGAVVLVGSDQSLIGKGKSSIYGATKGAIGQLAKSTAIDYAEQNIRVNCICPGTTDTPLYRRAVQYFADRFAGGDAGGIEEHLRTAQPIRRLATIDEIAAVILFLCSAEASYVTGALIAADGGLTAQ